MSEELKPCPFCGCIPDINRCFNYHDSWSNPWELSCTDCGITTRNCVEKEDAIDVWNTRPEPRCDRCKFYSCGWCKMLTVIGMDDTYYIDIDKDFYCKYFEPSGKSGELDKGEVL